MARRRKKSKKPPPGPAPKVDKSLPALPPQERPTFTPDLDTPSDIFSEPTTTDVSPRPPHSRRGDSSSNFRRDASPAMTDMSRRGTNCPRQERSCAIADHTDNTTLPATTYSKENVQEAADDGILLPFALDPNTAPGPSPLNRPTSKFADRNLGSEGKSSQDYFNRPSANHREALKENNSRSGSTERRRPPSPHIAYQEKGRQPSDSLVETLRKRKEVAEAPAAPDRSRSQHASPAAPSSVVEPFKLQDVPKNKKAEAKRKDSDSKESLQMQHAQHSTPAVSAEMSARLSRPLIEPDFTASPPGAEQDSPDTSGSSFSSHSRPERIPERMPERMVERPARGDSLSASVLKPAASITRSDRPTTPTTSHPERTSSTNVATANLNAGLGIMNPADSPPRKSFSDVPVPPARSAGRLTRPMSL
jgi:hypothetical protein